MTRTSTSLHTVIHTIFQPYSDGQANEHENFIVQGDDISIGGKSLTDVALVVNELATNAVKYGALASPSGTVRITTEVKESELILIWEELGSPPIDVDPDKGGGFGSKLIEQLVTRAWGGSISRDWRREGLVLRLSVPTRALTA